MSKKEKSALRERVESFARYKCKSIRAFEESMNFSNGTVAQYTDNTTRETLNKIKECYSDFDVDYILTGIKSVDSNIYATSVPHEFVQLLLEERRKHDEQIDRLINLVENKKATTHLGDTAEGA
jgi:hypothetical protein